jgi:hypothetical protein
MPGHRLQHEPETASRPLPGSGTVRRAGSPLVELALHLQRHAGNRSVSELVAGNGASVPTLTGATAATRSGPVGVQREPCIDCPDPDALAVPDTAELPESGAQG